MTPFSVLFAAVLGVPMGALAYLLSGDLFTGILAGVLVGLCVAIQAGRP